jgi:hypothetical protein
VLSGLRTLYIRAKKIKGFWLICMVFLIFWGALDNNMALCSFLILFLGIG